MRRRRLRPLTLLAVLAACGAVWAGPAAATPEQVLADQSDNGIIDGSYSPDDLQAAILLAQERAGAQADLAITAIRDAQARTLFGADPDQDGAAAPVGVPATAVPDDPPVLRLPQAPVAEPGATVPVPFVILSAIAGMMLLAGLGASTFRRLSRTAGGAQGPRPG